MKKMSLLLVATILVVACVLIVLWPDTDVEDPIANQPITVENATIESKVVQHAEEKDSYSFFHYTRQDQNDSYPFWFNSSEIEKLDDRYRLHESSVKQEWLDEIAKSGSNFQERLWIIPGEDVSQSNFNASLNRRNLSQQDLVIDSWSGLTRNGSAFVIYIRSPDGKDIEENSIIEIRCFQAPLYDNGHQRGSRVTRVLKLTPGVKNDFIVLTPEDMMEYFGFVPGYRFSIYVHATDLSGSYLSGDLYYIV